MSLRLEFKFPLENPIISIPKLMAGYEEPQSQTSRKRKVDDAYDCKDPFIDDTESANVLQDEKAHDFYVFSGKLPVDETLFADSKKKRKVVKKTDASKPVKKAKKEVAATKAESESDLKSQMKSEPDLSEKEIHKQEFLAKLSQEPSNGGGDDESKPASAEQRMQQRELEAAFTTLKEIAATIEFDKQKFPIALREDLIRAINAKLALSSKRTLESEFFDQLTSFIPFKSASLKKLIDSKVIPRVEEKNALLIADLTEKLRQEIDKTDPFVWVPATKQTLYDLIKLEMEQDYLSYYIKSQTNPNQIMSTDMKIRKILYSKICTMWPEGKMTATELSKEYANVKKTKTRSK